MNQAGPMSNGTMIRGADGALYFIPDKDLEAYRLTDEKAAPVREVIENVQDVAGFTQAITTLTPVIVTGGPLGHQFNCADDDPTETYLPAIRFGPRPR